MLEIVLGVLVVIGVFVFWCDVTDSWDDVCCLGAKTGNANPHTSSCDRNASSAKCPRNQAVWPSKSPVLEGSVLITSGLLMALRSRIAYAPGALF